MLGARQQEIWQGGELAPGVAEKPAYNERQANKQQGQKTAESERPGTESECHGKDSQAENHPATPSDTQRPQGLDAWCLSYRILLTYRLPAICP